MIFKRKLYDELLKWKNESDGSSAMLVEGARRVGKSTLVEEFAKKEYEDYLLLDFGKESTDIRNNFTENMGNLNDFFRYLFLAKGRESLPLRKSVIIFDEVQLFPQARQAIKYLVQDGRYDYIETGSLISIKKNVEKILIPSEEEKLYMFPMDFEEFLWANGDQVTAEAIRDNFEKKQGFDDSIHRILMRKFRTYMAVGGMPQAVLAYVDGKSFAQVDRQKRNILTLYEDDLRKYDEEENNEKVSVLFKTIPEQLENHNSHFKFSLVDKNARYKNYVHAVNFIAESMIGNECLNVTDPQVGLEGLADRSNFKIYMGDTGLLVTQYMKSNKTTGEDIYKAIIFDHLHSNFGMIMENIVAQTLRFNGYGLYFHEFKFQPKESKKENKYEIDFLIVRNKKLVPIEVKSSQSTLHKSFDYFKEKYSIKMEERYVIHTKNYKRENDVIYLPIYMTMCLSTSQ